MFDSVWPHRRQPTRLPRPWDSPGKNTGVGCHFLLQYMKVKRESEVAQLCPTPSNPMDCSLPGSSVHGISQARVLEWGSIAFGCKTYLVSGNYRISFKPHKMLKRRYNFPHYTDETEVQRVTQYAKVTPCQETEWRPRPTVTPELGLEYSREYIVWVYPLPDNMPACHTTWSSNKDSVIKGHFGISNKGFLNKGSAFQKSERHEKKTMMRKKCSVQCGFPPLGALQPSTCINDENWHSAWLPCIC